ncbi:hypothetical protein R1CP_38120 (plasmid) [Rhodococcus opacus]|uniref:Uncharacterized protein n=1 Tax=Rhodococcus opacus TaxID=37919 RepID=A0A1B1KHX5_RHOOP|nr:hypothetical protein R1CP_38120 [Rhodococcus opacus]
MCASGPTEATIWSGIKRTLSGSPTYNEQAGGQGEKDPLNKTNSRYGRKRRRPSMSTKGARSGLCG